MNRTTVLSSKLDSQIPLAVNETYTDHKYIALNALLAVKEIYIPLETVKLASCFYKKKPV